MEVFSGVRITIYHAHTRQPIIGNRFLEKNNETSKPMFELGGGLIYDDAFNVTWLQDAKLRQNQRL